MKQRKIISMNVSSQNAVRPNLAGNETHLLLQITLEKKFPHLQNFAYYSNHLKFKYGLHHQ